MTDTGKCPSSRAGARLADLLAYRLAVVAEAVSREVSQVYKARFDLSRDEWRVLAVLGEISSIQTRDAISLTTLDKVQISRAVARMQEKGLVRRQALPADRRNHVISLTRRGQSLYQQVLPEVEKIDASLADIFSDAQARQFNELLDQLLGHVQSVDETNRIIGS